jgi:hypothetical protein
MFFILNPFDQIHTFFCESVEYGISGSKCILTMDIALLISYQKEDVVLFVIHPLHILQNQECISLFQMIQKSQCKMILYVSEPLTLLYDKHAYKKILSTYRFCQFWTYTLSNQITLRKMIHPLLSERVHLVYPYFEYFNWILPKFEKKTDQILWIGNLTESRKTVFKNWEEDIEWIHMKEIWTKKDWTNLLEKYLYFINIHRIPKCPCLETFRIIPILANGGIVISEEVNEEEMNKWNGMNIYFGKREELYNVWKSVKKNIEKDPAIYFQSFYKICNISMFNYNQIFDD